jgi:hypothetical protein
VVFIPEVPNGTVLKLMASTLRPGQAIIPTERSDAIVPPGRLIVAAADEQFWQH